MAKSGEVQKSLTRAKSPVKKVQHAVQDQKKTGKERKELGDNKPERSDSGKVDEQK